MILIFGGTTEGRVAVRTLEEAGKVFYYSTKRNEQEIDLHHGIRLTGAMNAEHLTDFCYKHHIRLLIDAAHPFAEELHKNVHEVSNILSIPVIRLERIYPEIEDSTRIIWCTDYEDAIQKIRKEGILTLLALTGVQSINKLKSLWRGNIHCFFRILNRESSRQEAFDQNFPEKDLYYYNADEDECTLIQQLHPDAILIKESGLSGGFYEKIKAAQQLGIRIFALKRPPMPFNFFFANGEYGLHRQVEALLPGFFPLRTGLTTGTCAAAAAVAATWDIFSRELKNRPKEFLVVLPNGETIFVPVEPQTHVPSSEIGTNGNKILKISATVIKDAGDDPDITNGMEITANVAITFRAENSCFQSFSQTENNSVIIRAGEGIGIVTLPGLGLEMGSPAINPTPRKMIEENVKSYIKKLCTTKLAAPLVVTISLPKGEEIAKRTFNPRLGIEKGISIIGTSGIVKPFSSEAFVSSIRKSMEVAQATKSPRIVISSGAKSEKFIKTYYPQLPAQAFVHYGNFIGETLKIADELKIPNISLALMIGKAVKLAEGNLDTHSKKVTMNKNFVREIAIEAGCNKNVLSYIEKMNLARELWEIIPANDREHFCQILVARCHRFCGPLLSNGEITILLITENGEIYL